jgi:hypothetical protein
VVVGHVGFLSDQRSSGTVKVFNTADHLVAHRKVTPDRNHFHFILKPGRYELKLTPSRMWTLCPTRADVRVRANRTTHAKQLGAPCGSY